MTTTTTPATDKQLIYLAVLVESRDIDVDIPDVLDETTAIALIDACLAAPRLSPAPRGHYVWEGLVYQVRTSKMSGHNYALALRIDGSAFRTGRWVHAPGVVGKLRDELTVAEAASRGREHGVCHVCGQRVVKREDVTAGIHFACATRLEG